MAVQSRIKSWWKHAVVYQIYPASFCDSDGDGIGDIPGIVSKLDYIKGLGADVIWLSPMYDSPQVDMGYDIANYEDVYRPYGTLHDMDVLIREAHARGLRIMLDLVINHTSDQHAWFQASRRSKDDPKRDWYIWRPPKYSAAGERRPPNNWKSFFGGESAWTWDAHTGEYYLHLFAAAQPDLNWENAVTRRAIYASSMEFWLRRGVDGFRVDVVNVYSKPAGLPDAAVTDPAAPYQSPAALVFNGPRMHEFLSEMNAVLAPYHAITVGELGMTPDPSKVLRYVSAEAKQLDMVFQFDVVMVGHNLGGDLSGVTPRAFTLPQFKAAVDATQTLIRGNDAWTTVFLENHDQARSVSRFADDRPAYRAASARLLALLQACLSGTQYIYQGQEIGMVNAPKDTYPLANYLDISSQQSIDVVKARHAGRSAAELTEALDKAFDALQYLARDHGRIPIPWSTGRYGGFSGAAERAGKPVQEPWMKPHPLAGEINVEAQLADPDHSVLGFWTKMIAFRRAHPDLLVYSDYHSLRNDDRDTMLFVKEPHGDGTNGSKALAVLNFTTQDVVVPVPDAEELGFARGTDVQFELLASTHDGGNKAVGDALAPLEGRVYLVKP
ncbi:glycoside hydrolase family 13 protein [Niveomyces insectorum RCEF 264]|uniref:Glycoside hydrolase family 13 protein n=1 Tax=Niveomyces insectorum RCEF 264 TaxID=1081102 RepID=A0A167MB62_9HYPO|nr:glycoside hydrolase family 13 protein [Niveomyces insectorum RCEF 264]